MNQDTELAEIRASIEWLSGGGKKLAPGARYNGIYGTMTLSGLDDMVAVRDTRQRFADFGVPEDLWGKTWIDVGANVGACALEAARRGATTVGVEYRQDRVDLCNRIAASPRWRIGSSRFFQADLNHLDATPNTWRTPTYDYVWSTAVDNYLDCRPNYYQLLKSLMSPDSGVLFYECNVRRGGATEAEARGWLGEAGFAQEKIEFLGTGSCPFLKRKIYRVTV